MFNLKDLAEDLGGKVHGDENITIYKISTLSNAQEGDISFCTNPKYIEDLMKTKASAVLITEEALEYCNTNAVILDNPYMALAKVMELFDKSPKPNQTVSFNADISQSAKMGTDVTIMDGVTIGNNVEIGNNVVIYSGVDIDDNSIIGERTIIKSNVSICHDIMIGAHCIIHQNAVIGSDGFGNAQNENGIWMKIPQLGRVVIEDNVEIGACTTVDRGTIDDTIIRSGARIDNQVQIAHNVIVGENTAIAAQTGIAGSTTIGKNCMLAGKVGINGHIQICDQVIILASTSVSKNITTPGIYQANFPAKPRAQWARFLARLSRLDKLIYRVKKLEKELGKNNKSI